MSRSVTYNGITQFRPGGILKVNANALAQIGSATNGIIGLIGEADGGVPNTVQTLDDPALAKETFTSGPLADAIGVAFDPANDPVIAGGAFRVYAVKVNQGTQSTLNLYGLVPPVVGTTSFTDVASGTPTTTSITLTTGGLTPSAEVGNYLKVGQEVRPIISNTASVVVVSPALSIAPVAGDAITCYAMHDTAAAASSTTVINLTTGGLTVDAHIGNYLRIGTETRAITDNDASSITVGVAFSGAPATNTVVEIISPNWTFTSTKYGTEANRIKQEFETGAIFGSAWTMELDGSSQVSDDIGGKSYLDIEYTGQNLQVIQASGTSTGGSGTTIVDSGAAFPIPNGYAAYFLMASGGGIGATPNLRKIAATGSDATTLAVDTAFSSPASGSESYAVYTGKIHGGTLQATATANTCTLESTINVVADELEGLVIAITSGTGSGQRRRIAANTAGTGSTVRVSHAWTTNPDATSVYELRYVTAANATIAGSQGISTGLTTRVAANGGAEAQDLNITFTQNQTLQDLVNVINQNTSYTAYVPSGINPLLLVNDFDFDFGAWRVDIMMDRSAISTAPYPPVSPAVPWANHFRKDAALVVADINDKAEYATVARATGTNSGSGAGLPEYTGGAVGTVGDTFLYMSGAIRGVSTNTNWQSAFDALIRLRVNHVVPIICQDLSNEGYGSTATFTSVAAQLANHISLAMGVEKTERGGYIGMKGTRDEIIAQANTFNNADIHVTGQRHTVLNVDSTLTELDEWVSAVIAAGMRAGMPEVGEPMTHKGIRTTGMDQDSSWNPLDRTDANLLIQNGVLFAETISGEGTRWVRDLTSYVTDDNLAYAEGSVRDVIRFISYGLRTFLERRFTGIKARPANQANIKESTAEYLEQQRSDGLIVDSTDDNGNAVYAYHTIRVTISGDIARVRVQVFPVVGINFQLTDLYLQLPVIS